MRLDYPFAQFLSSCSSQKNPYKPYILFLGPLLLQHIWSNKQRLKIELTNNKDKFLEWKQSQIYALLWYIYVLRVGNFCWLSKEKRFKIPATELRGNKAQTKGMLKSRSYSLVLVKTCWHLSQAEEVASYDPFQKNLKGLRSTHQHFQHTDTFLCLHEYKQVALDCLLNTCERFLGLVF